MRQFWLILLLVTCSVAVQAQEKKYNRFRGRNADIDTIYSTDTILTITKYQLDSLLQVSITFLKEKDIPQFTDSEHRLIIRLSNSGFMAPYKDTVYFNTSLYADFSNWLVKTKYTDQLTRIYPDWVHSRGMGFFFPKLGIELDGTPYMRSMYYIEN
jgi:hypothetical protein